MPRGDANRRRGPIEPEAQRADDALDEAPDRVGVERELDGLDPTAPFDVGAARAVDHHLRHVGISEVRLERSEAGHLGDELVDEAPAS